MLEPPSLKCPESTGHGTSWYSLLGMMVFGQKSDSVVLEISSKLSESLILNPNKKGLKIHGSPSLLSSSKINVFVTQDLIS